MVLVNATISALAGVLAVLSYAFGAICCYVGLLRMKGKCSWGLITAKNEKGVLRVRIRSNTKEIYEKHKVFEETIRQDIKAGRTNDKARINKTIRDFFTILVGEYGAMSLIAWYDNDYNAAWEAIYPDYNRRILPRLRKMYSIEAKGEAGC